MKIEESLQDFCQKYNSCIVRIKRKIQKPYEYFYFNDVIEDEEGRFVLRGQLLTNKKRWDNQNILADDIIDFNPTWPKLGLINALRDVVFLYRRPDRQWRQGYFINAVVIEQFNKTSMNLLGLSCFSYDHLIKPYFAKEVFNPNYFSVNKAIDDIHGGRRLAAAINKDFFISSSWLVDGLYLGYKTTLVGKISNRHYLQNPQVELFDNINKYLIEQIQPFMAVRNI